MSTILLLAFWVPLAISYAVACIPDPAGIAGGLSGAWAHVAAAAYLTAALSLSHYRNGPWTSVVAWMMAWGVSIELAQLFVDGRSAQLADIAADAAGIAIGAAAYGFWRRRGSVRTGRRDAPRQLDRVRRPRMRICHVIESGATGALEMVLLSAETQRLAGHEVLIVYCRRPGAPADLRRRAHADVRLIRLRMRPFLPHLPVWCLRYARVLRRWNPDILHLHGSFAGFLGRLVAGRRFGGAVLFSTHCISLMHLGFSTRQRAAFRFLERLAQAACPAVYLPCTRPEQAVITRELGVPVRLLENAVDDRAATAIRPAGPPRTRLRRVVTCARIAPLKDPATFARVCRAVRSVDPDIRFEWIGDGDPQARHVLRRAGVHVTGWLGRDDALGRVAGACAYLSTSRWEGMPVSVLEAMFLGVPVLCRRAEWSEAIVREGVTGFLFADADGAAAALLSAAPSVRAKVAEAALAAARERFSQGRFASDLERICEDARKLA